ncbi:MAG: hypothetical protein CML05_20605 [Pseudozobellia sp.]|nr:hypothetical protein [Pseudozobellia sp.]|tara:strand:+ start:75673 stop:76551 length:879 start_codon:yes stop_codon:yes gene_type:complete
MENFKSHFKFNKQERSGIFFLLLIIVLLQIAYWAVSYLPFNKTSESLMLNSKEQYLIDSLKVQESNESEPKIFPFNPNYITDYKGYTLGMSTEEIDALHSFRKQGKFVNSAKEFQEVTHVSDSLLEKISPHFKFPDWVVKKAPAKETKATAYNDKTEVSTQIIDINSATSDQLKEISGIGDKLSARIVKFRDRLGGFLVNEQLYDVYGLEPNVVQRALKRFQVLNPPALVKINVNQATATELSQLVYINYQLARKIILYREAQDGIDSIDELKNIEGFPSDKIDRIALYLSL